MENQLCSSEDILYYISRNISKTLQLAVWKKKKWINTQNGHVWYISHIYAICLAPAQQNFGSRDMSIIEEFNFGFVKDWNSFY